MLPRTFFFWWWFWFEKKGESARRGMEREKERKRGTK